MSALERIANGLTRPVNPYSTALLSLFSVVWGLWLFVPMWDVFSRAKLFSRMQQVCQYESVWGLLAITIGLLIIIAIRKDSIDCLITAMGLCAWYWFMISMLMWWGDWQNTGGWTYGFVCLSSAYLYLNLRHNQKLYE